MVKDRLGLDPDCCWQEFFADYCEGFDYWRIAVRDCNGVWIHNNSTRGEEGRLAAVAEATRLNAEHERCGGFTGPCERRAGCLREDGARLKAAYHRERAAGKGDHDGTAT